MKRNCKPGFFKGIISRNGEESHKRLVILWAMVLLTYITIESGNGHDFPPDLVYGLIIIIAGGMGFTLFERYRGRGRQYREEYEEPTRGDNYQGGGQVGTGDEEQ